MLINYDDYKTENNEYLSPSNNKIYKTKKAFIAHIHYKIKDKKFRPIILKRDICIFCKNEYTVNKIKLHNELCWMNPKNEKLCVICNKRLKNYKNAITCSYSCSNKHFRSGENNGNWKESTYRSTCFLHHKHKCVVCDETKILDVHHFDENRKNNDPKNLIPLCPTHHGYIHSRYKNEVEQTVIDYHKNFNEKG